MKTLELTWLGYHINVGRRTGKALVHQYHSELRLSPRPDSSSQNHYSVEPVRSFRLHREMTARMRLYYHRYATLISIENIWSTLKEVFKDWNKKKMYYNFNLLSLSVTVIKIRSWSWQPYCSLYKTGNNNIHSNGTCSWSWVIWFLLLSHESSLGLFFHSAPYRFWSFLY